MTTLFSSGANSGPASASARKVSSRISGASSRSRSGESAFTGRSRSSRRPTNPIARSPDRQAATSRAHRCEVSSSSHSSYILVGTHRSRVPTSTSVSMPAVYASSSRIAACWSSRPARSATVRSSRTPSPPVRSTGGGDAPIVSSSRSTCRTSSIAAPAAARSPIDADTFRPDSGGGAGRVDGCTRPPRRCRPICRGRMTVCGSFTVSRPRASRFSIGLFAVAIVTPRSAFSTCPVGGPQVSRSRICRASGPDSSISLSRSPKCRVVSGPSPAGVGPSSSCTARIVRRSSAAPHTSARSRSSASRGSTSSAGWSTPRLSAARLTGSGSAVSASSRSTANSSNRFTARAADACEVAREASWPVSDGIGRARSGRARTSRPRAASSQPRNASASVRGRLRGGVVIRSTIRALRAAGRQFRTAVHLWIGSETNCGCASRHHMS